MIDFCGLMSTRSDGSAEGWRTTCFDAPDFLALGRRGDSFAIMYAHDQVRSKLASAVRSLYSRDLKLFQLGVGEPNITARLASYVQEEFSDWDVDAEYDRRADLVKKLAWNPLNPGQPLEVEPDISVHVREEPLNLLVIEAKLVGRGSSRNDLNKLRAFTSQAEFGYLYGVFLRLGPKGCAVARVFEGGQERAPWTGAIQTAIVDLIP